MAQPVKTPINIDFSKGRNQKVDPFQVPIGNFLSLVNTVFDKVGRLTKRNGFPFLATLPNSSTSYLTTFNDDLQALGASLLSYSPGQQSWVEKGSTYPLELSVMPLVRNAVQQVQGDVAIAPNGLICTVYTETNGLTVSYKYVIADSTTGQNIVDPTVLPGASATYGTPRVNVLGNYFYIVYSGGAGPTSLLFEAVSYVNPTATPVTGTLTASYTPATTVAFDAVKMDDTLYIAYNGAGGSGIQYLSVTPLLVPSSTFTADAAHQGTLFSLTADSNNNTVWITYYDSGTSNGYTVAINPNLIVTLAATQVITGEIVLNLASVAQSNVMSLFYEVSNNYSYDSGIPTHLIKAVTCTIGGSVGSPYVVVRSVGLASKAFLVEEVPYFLTAYSSPLQPSYFLIDGGISTAATPIVVTKLAYSNGGGYLTTGLPNTPTNGTSVSIPYRFKDLLEAQAPAAISSINLQTPTVYTQTGLNLSNIDFVPDGLVTAETGGDLHLTGGFLWMYDGFHPVEHSFFVWPDSVEATWSASGGSIVAKPDGSTNTNAYYYQVTYEWTDNQGNLFRSAPSIPVAVTTSGSGSSGSVVLNVPTLRLTYKVSTPVRIVIYRWSVANQTYFQVTSITTPIQNDTTIDNITYTDTLADASIVGNNIIYTTGGVLENVNAPASSCITLFDNRLWVLDAEQDDTFWFSKTILPRTPADLSDAQTYFAAPTIGAEGSTGKTKTAAPMDDKLVLFKDNAIYYLNGKGPNDLGQQSQYSDPIFVTSTVGCDNQRSIVMTPKGLMFQSNKGIWLLDRNLVTSYIGAEVEDFNSFKVTSAQAVPGTNQVRFAMSDGTMLMYDYYVEQWGEFDGIASLSSTVYAGAHTIVNQYGQVSQELANTYLDGPNPVLMSFKTSWLQLAGLRGYMRAFWFYFLGTFLSPHKLALSIAYDYSDSAVQGDIIAPLNYAPPYGSTQDPFYGSDGSLPYGGRGSLLNWRVFLERQRCKAFQITMQEVFDPTFGTVAGPGLTMSGLNCIVGLKKAYAPINSNQQVG